MSRTEAAQKAAQKRRHRMAGKNAAQTKKGSDAERRAWKKRMEPEQLPGRSDESSSGSAQPETSFEEVTVKLTPEQLGWVRRRASKKAGVGGTPDVSHVVREAVESLIRARRFVWEEGDVQFFRPWA